MTRKDYRLIADAVQLARYQCRHLDGSARTLDTFAEILAGDLHEDNPRFDRAQFLTAAGCAVPGYESRGARLLQTIAAQSRDRNPDAGGWSAEHGWQ